MILLLAIIIYVQINLLPKWILKGKYRQWEERFSWKIPFLKLSGLLICCFLALLLSIGIKISKQDTFIENHNAIYGFQFNKAMKDVGFEDGMRIISINGNKIEKIDEIVYTIIMEPDEVKVSVEKDGVYDEIVLNNGEKRHLMKGRNLDYIKPILQDENGNNQVKITVRNFGLIDGVRLFTDLWYQAKILINPFYEVSQNAHGFILISEINNIRGLLFVFSFDLIILVILNLLPLPGFSVGNFALSLVETFRKKLFSQKIKRIAAAISIFVVLGILVIRIFL